jgi:3-oxoacyl-[acyl-carrier-protein] synthase III
MTQTIHHTRAKIIGLGYSIPTKILTNNDLEKLVETSDEWITTRTGIKQRHIAADGESSSDLGKTAALNAINDAGLSPLDIDLIILATISPDMIFPSTACVVQEKIGAKNAAAFDISAACSGFPYALSIGCQFVANGTYKNVLVVAAETLTHFVDWTDRGTCVLFGDGAGAAVLSRSTDESGILSSYLGADGSYVDMLKIPAGGSAMPASQATLDERLHYLKMEGRDVFKIAVSMMVDAAHEALKRADITIDEVDLLIPHQANLRIINAVSKRLGIPEEKVFVNIDNYGNMSGATVIVGLCEAVQKGMVKKDSIIVFSAFGGGFTWGANVIRW